MELLYKNLPGPRYRYGGTTPGKVWSDWLALVPSPGAALGKNSEGALPDVPLYTFLKRSEEAEERILAGPPALLPG